MHTVRGTNLVEPHFPPSEVPASLSRALPGPGGPPSRPGTGDSLTSLSGSLGRLLNTHIGSRLHDDEMEALMSLRPMSEDFVPQDHSIIPSEGLNSRPGSDLMQWVSQLDTHQLQNKSYDQQQQQLGMTMPVQEQGPHEDFFHEILSLTQAQTQPAEQLKQLPSAEAAVEQEDQPYRYCPPEGPSSVSDQQATQPASNQRTNPVLIDINIKENSKEPQQQQQNIRKRGKKLTSAFCQVDGCGLDLMPDHIKPYHRRNRVCVDHMKSFLAEIKGQPSRYCNQCHKFHEIAMFDAYKHSCRQTLLKRSIKNKATGHDEKSGNRAASDGRGMSEIIDSSPEPAQISAEVDEKLGRQRVGKSPYSGGPTTGEFMNIVNGINQGMHLHQSSLAGLNQASRLNQSSGLNNGPGLHQGSGISLDGDPLMTRDLLVVQLSVPVQPSHRVPLQLISQEPLLGVDGTSLDFTARVRADTTDSITFKNISPPSTAPSDGVGIHKNIDLSPAEISRLGVLTLRKLRNQHQNKHPSGLEIGDVQDGLCSNVDPSNTGCPSQSSMGVDLPTKVQHKISLDQLKSVAGSQRVKQPLTDPLLQYQWGKNMVLPQKGLLLSDCHTKAQQQGGLKGQNEAMSQQQMDSTLSQQQGGLSQQGGLLKHHYSERSITDTFERERLELLQMLPNLQKEQREVFTFQELLQQQPIHKECLISQGGSDLNRSMVPEFVLSASSQTGGHQINESGVSLSRLEVEQPLVPVAWGTLRESGQSTGQSLMDSLHHFKETRGSKILNKSDDLELDSIFPSWVQNGTNDGKQLRRSIGGDVWTGLTDGMRDLGTTSDT